MTYITLTNEKRLVVTKYTTIYRGDNMSSAITFLIPTEVENVDMATASIFLSYIRADGEPDMVILNREKEMYNPSYYQYTLPVTCKLSRYPGQVSMWLQICDESGEAVPVIAKTSECVIRIHESKNMDDCTCDHQLTALYQLKKQIDNLSDNNGTGDSQEPPEDNEWEDMGSSDSESGEVWEDM